MSKWARILTIIGLVLNILGTAIVFKWGAPQPDFNEGIGMVLEDANPGVKEHNDKVRKQKREYTIMSRTGLGTLGVGFVIQVVAAAL